MSGEPTAGGTVTELDGNDQEQQQEQKPTETVEFWKTKAREQETRAKANAAAAKRLAEIEDANKSEAEKVADKLKQADTAIAGVPSKVAESLRAHLVELHKIDAEDADLFLTANDPELLLKQVSRLIANPGKRKPANRVPKEGRTPGAGKTDDGIDREFVRGLFKRTDS